MTTHICSVLVSVVMLSLLLVPVSSQSQDNPQSQQEEASGFHALRAMSSVGTWSANQKINGGLDVDTFSYAGLSVDVDGNVYALWPGDEGSTRNVSFSFRPKGGIWRPPQIVSDVSGIPFVARRLDMVVDTNGTPYALWADDRSGNMDLYLSYRLPSGQWSIDEKINDDVGTGDQGDARMALDSAGNVHVVWSDHRNSTEYCDIYYASRSAGGGWSANERVSDWPGTTYQVHPDIGLDGAGNIYVLWEAMLAGDPQILLSYRTGPGTWSEAEKVEWNYKWSRDPSLAVDSAGNALAVWESYNDGQIWYNYRPAGGSWGASAPVSESCCSAGDPDVTVGADGNVYLVWADLRDGDSNVYSAYYTGGGWSSATRINDDTGTEWQGYPVITTDAEGNLHAVWQDDRETAGTLRMDLFYSTTGPTPLPADLSVISVAPAQAVEGEDLVVGKATAIKVEIETDGAGAVSDVPVTLTYGGQDYTTFYVKRESNIGSDFSLENDSSVSGHDLSFPAAPTIKTVYFFSPDLSPSSTGTYEVTAEVQYGYDTNPANDSRTSTPVTVRQVRLGTSADGSVNLAFAKVDNAAVMSYMGKYGTGQFAAMFPVDESMVADAYVGQYETGATGQFRLDEYYFDFLHPLYSGMRLASPSSARFIAVLPPGWIDTYHPYAPDGTSGEWIMLMPEMVLAEAEWRSPGMMLHELGHSFGLHLLTEEYWTHPDGIQVTNGLDVEGRRLMQHGVKNKWGTPAKVYSMMGAYYSDRLPWIKPSDYNWLMLTHPGAMSGVKTVTSGDTVDQVLVAGAVSQAGEVTLADWWRLSSGTVSAGDTGDYAVEVRDSESAVLHAHRFTPTFTAEGGVTVDAQPFSFVIPLPIGAQSIHITGSGVSLASREVTPNAPQVTLVAPHGGEVYAVDDTIHVDWTGSDVDGDNLTYAVLYSGDDGMHWQTLAMGVEVTSHDVSAADLQAGTQNRMKVVATDGVNGGQDVSAAPFTIRVGVYLPLVVRN